MTLLDFWIDCATRRKRQLENHESSLNRLIRSIKPIEEELEFTQRQFVREARVKLDHAEKMVAFFKSELL